MKNQNILHAYSISQSTDCTYNISYQNDIIHLYIQTKNIHCKKSFLEKTIIAVPILQLLPTNRFVNIRVVHANRPIPDIDVFLISMSVIILIFCVSNNIANICKKIS